MRKVDAWADGWRVDKAKEELAIGSEEVGSSFRNRGPSTKATEGISPAEHKERLWSAHIHSIN
jgi:hypothetical protein